MMVFLGQWSSFTSERKARGGGTRAPCDASKTLYGGATGGGVWRSLVGYHVEFLSRSGAHSAAPYGVLEAYRPVDAHEHCSHATNTDKKGRSWHTNRRLVVRSGCR
jgi:hypothetical protein